MAKRVVLTEEDLSSAMDVRLPDFIYDKVKDHNTSLGHNPSFPVSGESGYDYALLKKRYLEVLHEAEQFDIHPGDEKKAMNMLSKTIHHCRVIESQYRPQLEKICFNEAMRLFGVPQGVIEMQCKLVDEIEPTHEPRIKPDANKFDYKSREQEEMLYSEIAKRRIICAIIQGGSYLLSDPGYLTITELRKLNPDLPYLYGKIRVLNDFLLFTHEEHIDDHNPMQGACVDVALGKNGQKTIINVQALLFPLLLQETVRGLLELMTSHGLPENAKEAMHVIRSSEFLLAEPWDLRLGVGIFQALYSKIDNKHVFPFVIDALTSLDGYEFASTMKEILGNTEEGERRMDELMADAEEMAKEEDFVAKVEPKDVDKSVITDDVELEEIETGEGEGGTDNPWFEGDVYLNGRWSDSDAYPFGYFDRSPAYNYGQSFFLGKRGGMHSTCAGMAIKDWCEDFANEEAEYYTEEIMSKIGDYESEEEYYETDEEKYEYLLSLLKDTPCPRDVVNAIANMVIDGRYSEQDITDIVYDKILPEYTEYNGKDITDLDVKEMCGFFGQCGYNFESYMSEGTSTPGRIWLDKEFVSFYNGYYPSSSEMNDIITNLAREFRYTSQNVTMEMLMDFYVIIPYEDYVKTEYGTEVHEGVKCCTVEEYIEGVPFKNEDNDEEKEDSDEENVEPQKPKKMELQLHLLPSEKKWRALKAYRDSQDRKYNIPKEKAAGTVARYNALRYPYSESLKRGNQVLSEDASYRNMKPVRRLLRDRSKDMTDEQAFKTINKVMSLVPNVKMLRRKFLLGVTRMYLDGQLDSESTLHMLNRVIHYLATSGAEQYYDRDVNGYSADEFIQRNMAAVKASAKRDRERPENVTKSGQYKIKRIDTFDEARPYSRYTNWCVCSNKKYFDNYTKESPLYFCLRNDYKELPSLDDALATTFDDGERVTPKGFPLDSYGLSMFAITVFSDGTLNSSTVRWNEGTFENGYDVDHNMTEEQIEQILGVRFEDVFKPYTEEELSADKQRREDEFNEADYSMQSAARQALLQIKNGSRPEEVFEEAKTNDGELYSVKLNGMYNAYDAKQGKYFSNEWFSDVDVPQNGHTRVLNNNNANILDRFGRFAFDNWCKFISRPDRFGNRIVKNEGSSALYKDIDMQPLVSDDRIQAILPYMQKEGGYRCLIGGSWDNVIRPNGEVVQKM